MRGKMIGLLVLVCITFLAGCGGGYILTVPEHVGPAGGQAAVIARLQRSEISLLAQPVEKVPVRFTLSGEAVSVRAGYTDKLGYAGTVFKMPLKTGRYDLIAQIQDSQGIQAKASGAVFVLDPREPVAAVDLDSILDGQAKAPAAAVEALKKLAANMQIVYLTRNSPSQQANPHANLAEMGLPDGAILTWTRQRWHVQRDGRFNIPRVVIESRLVSQLASLRKTLPGLTVGICDSQVAGRAFADAGMKAVLIGQTSPEIDNSISCASWAELNKLDL